MSGEILESEIGATEALQEGIVPGGPTIAEVDEANATETYVSRAPRRGYVILSALATPFVAASAAIAANQSGAPRALADATPIEQTFGGFDPALSTPTTGAEALAQISPAADSVFEGTSVLRPTAAEMGKHALQATPATPDYSYIQYAVLPRYTGPDRPDDPKNLGKPQFKFYDMTCVGGPDNKLDAGFIQALANYQQNWLLPRDNGGIFRFDTYTDPLTKKRGLDISTLQFPPTITEPTGRVVNTACSDFPAKGAFTVDQYLDRYVLPKEPNKIAVVILDSTLGINGYCGIAGFHPPKYPGNTVLYFAGDPKCTDPNNPHFGDILTLTDMFWTRGYPLDNGPHSNGKGQVTDDTLDVFSDAEYWPGYTHNVVDLHLDQAGDDYLPLIEGTATTPGDPYIEKIPLLMPKNTVEVDVTGRGEIDMISASLGKRACISAVRVKQCLYSVPATEKPRFTEVERYKDSRFAGWGGNVTPGMGKNRQLQDVGSRKVVRGKFVKRTTHK